MTKNPDPLDGLRRTWDARRAKLERLTTEELVQRLRETRAQIPRIFRGRDDVDDAPVFSRDKSKRDE